MPRVGIPAPGSRPGVIQRASTVRVDFEIVDDIAIVEGTRIGRGTGTTGGNHFVPYVVFSDDLSNNLVGLTFDKALASLWQSFHQLKEFPGATGARMVGPVAAAIDPVLVQIEQYQKDPPSEILKPKVLSELGEKYLAVRNTINYTVNGKGATNRDKGARGTSEGLNELNLKLGDPSLSKDVAVGILEKATGIMMASLDFTGYSPKDYPNLLVQAFMSFVTSYSNFARLGKALGAAFINGFAKDFAATCRAPDRAAEFSKLIDVKW